jgi:exopolysaccharide production protein ExoQ
MSPAIASILCWSFIILMMIRDVRKTPGVSHALWVPVIWIAICCSRPVEQWLYGGGWENMTAGGIEAGSPLDRNVNTALMLLAGFVLFRRGDRVGEIVRRNRWFLGYFIFCFVTILWSDFPLVAFKRWTRMVGDLMMILVIMTEADPSMALSSVFKRSAYLLLPTSILLIKYYPHLGRSFSAFTGEGQQTGVTINKNTLGAVCMVMGLFFVYHFLKVHKFARTKQRRQELAVTIFILWMIAWLMWQANSATSLAGLVLGVSIILLLGLRAVNKRFLGAYVLTGIVVFSIAAMVFDANSAVIGALGRDSTLTGRTELWGEVLEMVSNPLFGTGFESFWLGERLEKLWALHWWQPTQAHNGYLEIYINLGIAGLFMLAGIIFTTYRKGRHDLFDDPERGRMRLGVLAAIVVYNWTEAAFRFSHPVFLAFTMISIDPPKLAKKTKEEPANEERERHSPRVVMRSAVYKKYESPLRHESRTGATVGSQRRRRASSASVKSVR